MLVLPALERHTEYNVSDILLQDWFLTDNC